MNLIDLNKENKMRTNQYLITLASLLLFALPNISFAEETGFTALNSRPDYEVNAAIETSLEFNDNIDNEAVSPESSFTTHIRPKFSISREGARLSANFNYRGDYSFYTGKNLDPEYQHTLDAKLSANVIEDLFFINISESMQQVYENLELGEFQASDDFDDSRNRNVFTVAPYFSLAPSQKTNITLGYNFIDTRYSQGETNTSPSFLSFNADQYNFKYNVNQSHNPYFKINHELNDRTSLYTGGGYTRQIYNDEESIDLSRYNLYVGGSYQFSENLSASIEAGPNYSVPDSGDAKLSPYVQASINYSIGNSVFSFSYNTSFEDDLEAGETVNKSSYSLNWAKKFERTQLTVGLTYNTYTSSISYIQGAIDQEQGNTISPRVTINYDLTDRTSLFLNYNAIIFEKHELGDHRHTAFYGIKYDLSEDANIGLSHRLQYTIPYIESEYFSNQIMFDFAYSF